MCFLLMALSSCPLVLFSRQCVGGPLVGWFERIVRGVRNAVHPGGERVEESGNRAQLFVAVFDGVHGRSERFAARECTHVPADVLARSADAAVVAIEDVMFL